MIAKFTVTEDGKRELMRIWLEGNRQAHDFISEEYWLSHFDQVGEALSSADVFICQEEGKLRGFCRNDGRLPGRNLCGQSLSMPGNGKSALECGKRKVFCIYSAGLC